MMKAAPADSMRCSSRGVRRVARLAGEALAGEGGVGADQLFEAGAGAAEDHRQVGLAALGKLQLQPAAPQERHEAHRVEALQHLHRRHVERLGEGLGDAHRAVEGLLEVARLVAAEGLGHVGQQGFGVDQAFVEGQAVEKGLERRAGRAGGPHHVHVAEALGVG
jgi:hypothetical protein